MLWREHPLLGPDGMPVAFGGGLELDHQAWIEYADKLDRERELETLLAALVGSRRILDVGSGTGTLTQQLAQRFGRVTVVEPSTAQYSRIKASEDSEIEIIPGRAEALPVSDGAFDAVVATWVLHYTNDPFLAVAEFARALADTPGSRVCISQAAPGNVLVDVVNALTQIAGRQPIHHGFLLAGAIDVLEMRGFSISLTSFPMTLRVPDNDPVAAASLLQRMHYVGHPQAQDMRRAITPVIADQLARTPGILPADGVLLVAKRQ